MSDNAQHAAEPQHHESHETHEHEARQAPTWIVRMALGIGGILLLAFAVIASQMNLRLGGPAGAIVPWLVVAAILFGAAAVIELITSTVWITLIAGIFLTLAAFVIAGRFVVEFDASAHAVFEVDRYTGETRLCTRAGCQTLAGDVELPAPPSLSLKLPRVLPPERPAKH